jgi:hypothetical protein
MLSNNFDPIVEIVDFNQTFSGGIVVSKFVFSRGRGGAKGEAVGKGSITSVGAGLTTSVLCAGCRC